MDIDEELSVPLLQSHTDVVSGRSSYQPPPSSSTSSTPPTHGHSTMTELKFALEGLSCSSCTNTVKKAVESISDIPPLVLVTASLLPEQLLTVRYDDDDDDDAANTLHYSTVANRIMDRVQSIGFDAVLLSHQQIPSLQIDKSKRSLENSSTMTSNATTTFSPSHSTSRVLFVKIEFNGPLAMNFFQQQSKLGYVLDVEHIHPTVHHMTTKNTLFKALRYTSTSSSTTTTTTASTKKKTEDPFHSLLDDTPTTFKLHLNTTPPSLSCIRGIRDLLQGLEEETINQGGVGSITVLDPTSYKLQHDAQEQRRNQEVENWKNGFIYSLIFSIPVFLLAMVLPSFPKIHHIFISGSLWNIRYDELLQFVLSTPVQFIPGAKFYRDAYYSIKSNSLGMSFLIASGTTAAYFYSCYVVYHNARYSSNHNSFYYNVWSSLSSYMIHMEEMISHSMDDNDDDNRMMPTFETSALLITFVYLGKYLECRAKGYASRAISQLAQLTPETAVLVGIMNDPDYGTTDHHGIQESTHHNTITTVNNDDSSNNTSSSSQVEECKLLEMDENAMKDNTISTLEHPIPIQYYNEEREIPLALLQRNDVLLVRPGQRIPTDGKIILGSASIDESVITGESMPVTKSINQPVIAGTCLVDGSIHILVTHLGDENTISKIIKLVETAQSSKPPMQAFADRVSKIFAPTVFVCAIVTYIVWCILLNTVDSDIIGQGQYKGFNTWTFPLLFAISVLVVACPCALGLAVPTAIMVGSGVGARHGILIKNGESLEQMNHVTVIAIDKTGTLTEGNPTIEDIMLLSQRCFYLFPREEKNGLSESVVDASILIEESQDSSSDPMTSKTLENIFFLAACVENRSQHPLAKGIIAKAASFGIGQGLKQALVQVDDFVSEVGSGVKSSVHGVSVYIGNRRGLDKNNIQISVGTFEAMERAEKRGQTAVVIAINGRTEAVLGFIDKAKDDACSVMTILQHSMGMKVFMLTGDNYRTARIIAGKIGLPMDNIVADLTPDRKVDFIQRLQKQKEKVAMIGDGINDSPALAAADVGIAIAAGTDIAMESAGIILVNSRLSDVVTAFALSRRIYSRIRMNFIWALGYNICAIPLAAGILYPMTRTVMPPYIAAVTMILSSLSVITSSLLLNSFKAPTIEKRYGHALRKGQLGLERIKINREVTVDVRNVCESMESGGPCSCKDGFCVCFPCEEHGNM